MNRPPAILEKLMFSNLPEKHVPAPVRLPTAYGYGRQSHRDAIDANEGIPNQGNRTRVHWETFL